MSVVIACLIPTKTAAHEVLTSACMPALLHQGVALRCLSRAVLKKIKLTKGVYILAKALKAVNHPANSSGLQ